jgi:predicted amidohydrolase YtcJ
MAESPLLNPQQLNEQVGEASRSGYQIAVHAIGDAANAMVLDAYGKAQLGGRRPRVEHAQIVDPADLEKFRRFQVIASMQPTHQTSDRLMAEIRLGPDRLHGAYAWNTLEKLGVSLAFGSDFPVESPNPFAGLSAAISRQDMNGQPAGGWRPEERVSLGQALHGFTRGAAYAGFAEGRIGALEAGKWADFIIVDRDISKVDAPALARTNVLESWVAGKKVWARPASAGAGERGR